MYTPPTELYGRVGELLRDPIPNGKQAQIEHLILLDATLMGIAKARADWWQLLAEKKNQMLHPKDKDLTELDRKVQLTASVAVIERDFLFITDLYEMVKLRVDTTRFILTLAA